ncbi:MAG: YdcF family protein [Trebonia sp.]
MFVIWLAVAAFLLFLIGLVRDPRSFGNAVLLGLTLAFGALAVVEDLAQTPDRGARLLLLLVLLAVASGPFLVAGYLVLNGITLARKERFRPANLLPLAAGIGILAVIALTLTAERLGSVKVTLATGVTDLLSGYVSFLLVSYVIYSFVYGRLAALTGHADFVIVLGAGLRRDGRVTPLLARRLDRGREVHETIASRSRGGPGPVLIVSGGKGGDERTSEASAMARYLAEQGFPADQVMLEDQSRNTDENLRFSKALADSVKPGARCLVVTSNYHVLRTAIIARRVGVRGQVTGAPTAGYYWPSAMLREFAAVFLSYRAVNFTICALIVCLPVAYVTARIALTRI